MKRLIVLLMLGLLAAAGMAEQVTPDALRLLVEYSGDGGVTLVWKNLTEVPLTLEYSGTPITRVATVDGREVPMTAMIDAMLVKATVPPGGEKRSQIDPARFYDLVPGEAYLVTVACQVLQADSGIGYTFPYVAPTAQQAFSSGWTSAAGRGVEARLNLALNPADGRGEARVAFRNAGDTKAEVYDRAMLNAKVWRAGKPVNPSTSVKVKMGPLRTARLPRFAMLDLPLEQFNDHQPPPAGRVAVWLGHQQYVLEPGVRYRIDAATSLPGEGGKPFEVKLRPVEVYLPAEAAPPAENPVTVSMQYLADGAVKVIFTNALDHPLQFTGDVISAADRFGASPQSTTSARPPGLWPETLRTPVPARGEASFTFQRHHFRLTPGEWYRMTGAWMLRDEVTKREYAVSAAFPYLAPPPNPLFAGSWQPVAGRPGLEVRLSGALCPAVRPNAEWQPSTWIAYRNIGKTAMPVFDFPTLDVKVRGIGGNEVPGRIFNQTGIPNIETFPLPAGAVLVLPARTHPLHIDPTTVPDNTRYTLDFENFLFPLATGDRYRMEGTVRLPDGKKTLEAPFGRVGISVL
ncbi:MAG: hypothetical protein ACYDCO_08420 [Armatimonadota bacterium]